MLCHRQIHAPILIKVRNGAPALFAIHGDSGSPGRKRTKPSLSVSNQNQTNASVVSGGLRIHSEEVLRQEKIVISVAVEIRDGDPKGRRESRLNG